MTYEATRFAIRPMDENPFESPKLESLSPSKRKPPPRWYWMWLAVPPLLCGTFINVGGRIRALGLGEVAAFLGFAIAIVGPLVSLVLAWRICDRLTGRSAARMFFLFVGELYAMNLATEAIANWLF